MILRLPEPRINPRSTAAPKYRHGPGVPASRSSTNTARLLKAVDLTTVTWRAVRRIPSCKNRPCPALLWLLTATLAYSLPNDGDEQTRLDKQHLLWRMALDGDLGLAPICAQSPPNVLDVATGTGAWAIDFGRQNPECQVIGTDLRSVLLLPICTSTLRKPSEVLLGDPSDISQLTCFAI